MATFGLTMLVSSDVSRARDFYRDILGLTVGTDQAPHWVDFNLGGGVLLGIHPVEEPHLIVQPGSISNGFVVDDVDAFVAQAKSHGVTMVADPQDEAFGRLAILTDPDGYTVQIYTPKKTGADTLPATDVARTH